MLAPIQIRKAGMEDIPTIRSLAYGIWPVAYKDILSIEQLNYMLELIYSPEAISSQINEKHHQFLLLEQEGTPLGFASYNKLEEAAFKLQKLYVLPETQGMGIGKALLDKVKQLVKEEGASALHLNVNKNNKAIRFYEKQGFTIYKEEQIPIGQGYIMDDYAMVCKIL